MGALRDEVVGKEDRRKGGGEEGRGGGAGYCWQSEHTESQGVGGQPRELALSKGMETQ